MPLPTGRWERWERLETGVLNAVVQDMEGCGADPLGP